MFRYLVWLDSGTVVMAGVVVITQDITRQVVHWTPPAIPTYLQVIQKKLQGQDFKIDCLYHPDLLNSYSKLSYE